MPCARSRSIRRWHDAAYVGKHPGIQPAVFEPLVIGLLTALTTRTLGRVVANLGWTQIELPRPMLLGETMYAESTFGELRASHSRPDQGIAMVESRAYVGERRPRLQLSARAPGLSPRHGPLRGRGLLRRRAGREEGRIR